jgi:hypothetical protein
MNTRPLSPAHWLVLSLTAALFVTTSSLADTDCVALAQAMRQKHSWWKSDDFNSDLEEWIKTSNYSQFRKQGGSSMNLGIAIEGVPLSLGAERTEDVYQSIKQQLAAGKHLRITSHSREQFVEENLSDAAMDVLLRCVIDQGSGFHAAAIRHKTQQFVTLALVYRPVPGAGSMPCQIKDILLSGLSYANPKQQHEVESGLTLADNQYKYIYLKRTPGKGEVKFEAAFVGVTPSIGQPRTQDIPEVKAPPSLPPFVWKDDRTTAWLLRGGGPPTNAAYFGIPYGRGVFGKAILPLGANVYPRIQDSLSANLRLIGGGVWTPAAQPIFSTANMGLQFSNVAWDEKTHTLTFDWETVARNTRFKVWDIHAAVQVEVLTKEKIFTKP